ncbi:MAG: hypothetical protein LBN36_08945 [Clostridiales Family XIII bacterium]|jgi:hypothetical protein|nr:hypothetical protein [Clostridiales Family XIII bacterium]
MKDGGTEMQYFRIKRNGLVILLLALIVTVGLCPLPAFAAPPATIELGNISGSQTPGDAFTVPVTIADNPGFAAATLEFTYDHSVLEVVSLSTAGTLLDAAEDLVVYDFSKTDAIAYFNGLGSGTGTLVNIASDGTLFNITFKVKSGATTGNYNYSARLYQGQAKNFIDKDGGTVAVSFQSGSVGVDDGTDTGSGGTGTGSGGTGTGTGTGGSGTGTGGTGTGTSTGGSGTGTGGTGTGTGGTGTGTGSSGTGTGTGTGSTGTGTDGTGTGGTGTGTQGRNISDEPTPQGAGDGSGFDFLSLPWGWILLILAVLAGGLFFFILYRRRKKDYDEDEHDDAA